MGKSIKLRDSTAIAILSSSALATGWYVVANAVLSGTTQTILPVFGAIAIASCVPSIILNRAAKRQYHDSRLSLSQRLDAFDRHACVNIVSDEDKLTEINEKLLELTGYDRDDLVNRPVSQLYDEACHETMMEIRATLRRGESWEGETALRRKDGLVIYTQSTVMPLFDSAGQFAGSISVRTDVSRTNELIAERHTAQTLYELRDDVWIIDSETETFSYMNRTAEGRFNTNIEDYRSRSLSEMSYEQDTTKVLQACRALKASGTATTRFETVVMGMPADVSIKFLPGAEGAGRYLILISDISERIAQEKNKSAFISTVSHELRSPLTSIKGAMGLLLSRSAGELPDKAVSLLEIAHRNSDRLILIINDILDLDKIANGEMEFEFEDVDLAALVHEADQATAMLQQRFGVQILRRGMDTPVPFHTDPNRFIQVLTNLLSNAYKFSAPNSTIYIDINDEGQQIRVSIRDEGQGIPVDEQHKIFNRFSDMTNSDRAMNGGTGLGLNICKAIVENMGGTIGFDTIEGVGTTFHFRLPKTTSLREPVAEAHSRRRA